MEEFKVITKGLKNAGNDLIQISKNIRATESSINTIRSGLRNKIVREEEIGRRLKDISTAVDQIGGKLSQYGERVITISERYEQTERSITDFSKESVDGAVSAGIGVITDLAAGEASGQPDAAEGSDGTQKEFAFIKGEIEGNGEFLGMESAGSAAGSGLGGTFDTEWKSGISWDQEKDENGNIVRKLSSATLLSAAVAGEAYLAKGSAKGNVGLFRGEVNGSVGKVSAKGEVKAALVQDGKLAPQIMGRAEASAVGAEGDVSVGFGTENNNAHAKAEGKLASATAYAEGGVGKITYEAANGQTKTGYGVKGEAGAEAYLAEGSVSGGISIFGVKIDVSLGGKLGGAGGKVGGYATTGGVSGTISAGLGIGAEVGIDIDWSGFKFGW